MYPCFHEIFDDIIHTMTVLQKMMKYLMKTQNYKKKYACSFRIYFNPFDCCSFSGRENFMSKQNVVSL